MYISLPSWNEPPFQNGKKTLPHRKNEAWTRTCTRCWPGHNQPSSAHMLSSSRWQPQTNFCHKQFSVKHCSQLRYQYQKSEQGDSTANFQHLNSLFAYAKKNYLIIHFSRKHNAAIVPASLRNKYLPSTGKRRRIQHIPTGSHKARAKNI